MKFHLWTTRKQWQRRAELAELQLVGATLRAEAAEQQLERTREAALMIGRDGNEQRRLAIETECQLQTAINWLCEADIT